MLDEDKFHLENILVHEFGAHYLSGCLLLVDMRDRLGRLLRLGHTSDVPVHFTLRRS